MEKELETDNRKLGHAGQEELHKRIVRMMGRHGDTAKAAEICECSRRLVQMTWKKYREDGVKAIRPAKRGRTQDSGALSREQQKEIQRLIVGKCPEQLKMPGFLWDRTGVAALINP
jgi:transposase